jgi:hypothetical protein
MKDFPEISIGSFSIFKIWRMRERNGPAAIADAAAGWNSTLRGRSAASATSSSAYACG